MIEVTSWHDEVPYNATDSPFVEVISHGETKPRGTFRIELSERFSEKESSYVVTREGLPYATITFVWHKPFTELLDLDPHAIENSWLFEKFTGLSRTLYPKDDTGSAIPDFNTVGEVKITGTPEALRTLQ